MWHIQLWDEWKWLRSEKPTETRKSLRKKTFIRSVQISAGKEKQTLQQNMRRRFPLRGGRGFVTSGRTNIQSVRSSQSSNTSHLHFLCVFLNNRCVLCATIDNHSSKRRRFGLLPQKPTSSFSFLCFFLLLFFLCFYFYLEYLKVQTIQSTTWVLVRVSAVSTSVFRTLLMNVHSTNTTESSSFGDYRPRSTAILICVY